jgi:hypothetical protein
VPARAVLAIEAGGRDGGLGDTISYSTPDVGWGLAPPVDLVSPRRKVEPREAGRVGREEWRVRRAWDAAERGSITAAKR